MQLVENLRIHLYEQMILNIGGGGRGEDGNKLMKRTSILYHIVPESVINFHLSSDNSR